jgi:hypothetical protein
MVRERKVCCNEKNHGILVGRKGVYGVLPFACGEYEK